MRTRLGARLARECPVPADIVSGVPDSSIAAAIGYSTVSSLPFTEVFCKNRYIARTFIKPDDALRKNAIQLKYNPLRCVAEVGSPTVAGVGAPYMATLPAAPTHPRQASSIHPRSHVLAGKRVVLVDDSLVRGNTLAQLVPLMRRAGAKEVHIRISSPPIRHPCYYGVDIGSYEELIAHNLPDVEAIRMAIGADSLAYLSHEGMMEAVVEGRDFKAAYGAVGPVPNAGSASHCSACFTGVYPIKHELLAPSREKSW